MGVPTLMALRRRLGLAAAALLAATAFAAAQADDAGLTGALAKIARTGEVVVAARDDAAPFSFRDRAGRPVGYSIDLCEAIVEEIGRTLGRDDLRVAFKPVTAETRLAAVISGDADLECGATTATAERARVVSFSPLIFVAGTRILVRKGTPWRDFHDLAGKRIAVTAGTTNLAVMTTLNDSFRLAMTLVATPDHEQAFRLLGDGEVDGFAADDVLLAGLLARHHARDRLEVVGEMLSYEPYGIVYRHDDLPMKEAVERAFATLAASNDLAWTYARWFERRLPNGELLGIPMSPQLEAAFGLLREPANAEPKEAPGGGGG
ncbi:amino acid ABC transporter substrate-binding protein (PAAT family) [Roseiarcus fermentans]|uniref:Amino acid ABC transporter substrate-binding protein (PAAT family) n=1 Tax=Roseiarcus fermentans TaxID=1473586 RepID=A0A366F363_9HYPH|nr:amino acid ABC transporter substrate-binding protein [Roseiarcus fermentans]RBP09113.1 amino acid ABC transporter substrate-binding protein (PAAT family) [Roseiarcus fermentans]